MGIKAIINKSLSSLGLTLKGHHYIHQIILNTKKKYIIEIIGLGGKTVLLNNIISRRAYIINRIKPHFSDNELKNEKIIPHMVDVKMINLLVKHVSYSETFYHQIQRILDKQIIYSKYSSSSNIITDEGLIKENLKLIVELASRNDSSLRMYLSKFIFIILLPDLDLVIDRYFSRNKTPFSKKEKFKQFIYTEYNATIMFAKYLDSIKCPYLLINDNDAKHVEKILKFLDSFS